MFGCVRACVHGLGAVVRVVRGENIKDLGVLVMESFHTMYNTIYNFVCILICLPVCICAYVFLWIVCRKYIWYFF